MTPKRRFTVFLSLAVVMLLSLGGCTETPTTLVVSVSLVNPQNAPQDFPPSTHSGDFSDDVCYVRLIDSAGLPVTLWESSPYSASALASVSGRTDASGVHIVSFVFNPSDSAIAAATLPLRLEAFLFDDDFYTGDVSESLNPTTPPPDTTCYTVNPYHATPTTGKPGWYSEFTLPPQSIKNVSLSVGTIY